MGWRQTASRVTHHKAGRETSQARRRNPLWLLFGIALILVVGCGGSPVSQRQDKDKNGNQPLQMPQPIAVLQAADYHSLVFSANDSNIVFFGHHAGIMRSLDGGKTWQPLVSVPDFDAMSLVIDHGDSHLMYVAGHLIFQVSRDGGVTWSPVQNNLPSTDIHAFAVSPGDANRLFAFIYREGFFRSGDGGLTWEHLSTQLPGDVMTFAINGGNPETLYAASMMAGVFRTTDGGQSWVSAGEGLGSKGLMAIAVDTKTPKTVYAGGGAGLYKSTDGGDSWTKLAFPGSNVAALAISSSQPGLLLTITVSQRNGEIYRSEDGGVTWR